MMMVPKALRQSAFGAAIMAAVFVVPAEAQAPSLAMLDGLDRGEWEVRFRGAGDARKICLRNGRELIQIRHRDPGCSRVVIEDGASEVTVQYSCRGNGYGRTSIRKETGRLVQLTGQGIEGGLPFQFTAEARRIGACQ